MCFILVNPLTHADDTSSGCGLGWAVTKKNSLLSSTVRAYTNSTFSNTIAMTSGTSGCAKHNLVKNKKKADHFIEVNYNDVLVEMAKGKGEYLNSFAATLGCSQKDYESFAKFSQKHYPKLIEKQDAPIQFLKQIKSLLKRNPALEKSCQMTS